MKKRRLSASSIGTLVALVLLGALVSWFFVYTVHVRAPWLGNLKTNGHQFITGSTLTFVKNWVDDGILHDHFTLFQEVRSAINDNGNIFLRFPYLTYPLGTFLPLYAFDTLGLAHITPAHIMQWNLLNQFLSVVTLTLTSFLVLRKWKFSIAQTFLFSVPVGVVMYFLPGPMYWHQNTFFADQAIILPFSLLILTEVISWFNLPPRTRKALSIIQGIILFWGTYTDWLFVFVTIVLFLVRLATGQLGKKFISVLKKGAALVWPSIAAVVLYAVNVLSTGQLKYLFDYFLFRTGFDADGQKYIKGHELQLFTQWLPLGYGKVGQVLVIAVIAITVTGLGIALFLRIKKKPFASHTREVLALLALVVGSSVFQTSFFENHTVIHNFSSLKYEIVLGLFPFILLPAWVITTAKSKWQQAQKIALQGIIFTLAVLSLALAIVYVRSEFPRYKDFFGPYTEPAPQDFGNAVRRNTTKKDVLLSPELNIDHTTPFSMYYANNTVAKVKTWDEINDVVAIAKNPRYIIVVTEYNAPWPALYDNLRKCATKSVRDSFYTFTYLEPTNFGPSCKATK